MCENDFGARGLACRGRNRGWQVICLSECVRIAFDSQGTPKAGAFGTGGDLDEHEGAAGSTLGEGCASDLGCDGSRVAGGVSQGTQQLCVAASVA